MAGIRNKKKFKSGKKSRTFWLLRFSVLVNKPELHDSKYCRQIDVARVDRFSVTKCFAIVVPLIDSTPNGHPKSTEKITQIDVLLMRRLH